VKEELSDIFPMSKTKVLKGSRRIVREKVMQIIFSYRMSETDIDVLFSHIFGRDFNFGDNEENLLKDKLLRPDEVFELEADIPITWAEVEIEFAQKLLRNTIATSELTDEKMKVTANNWEFDRITLVDRILIEMACAEFTGFPDIPPKVTINEAIDIAKKYSTDKSGNFINGILDTMLTSLKNDGLVDKKGRGLKEKTKGKTKNSKPKPTQ
jgi:N utilization substance protein B